MKIAKVEGGLLHLSDGKTMPVSNKINPKFIHAGMAEVSQIDGVVTFIKMIKTEVTVSTSALTTGSSLRDVR